MPLLLFYVIVDVALQMALFKLFAKGRSHEQNTDSGRQCAGALGFYLTNLTTAAKKIS
jgi:hypothetical protein